MTDIKAAFKRVIRDQLAQIQGTSPTNLVGTVATVNADGSVMVSASDGTQYKATPMFPLVPGQQCILVFAGQGVASAIPTSTNPAAVQVIHPPFFTGAAGMRFASTNFGSLPGGVPYTANDCLVEDNLSAKVFLVHTGISSAWAVIAAAFSPAGRYLAFMARTAFGGVNVSNVVITLIDLGSAPFDGPVLSAPDNLYLLERAVVLYTVTQNFAPLQTGLSSSNGYGSIQVTDTGVLYWLPSLYSSSGAGVYWWELYKRDPNQSGGNPQFLGSNSLPLNTSGMFLGPIFDGDQGLLVQLTVNLGVFPEYGLWSIGGIDDSIVIQDPTQVAFGGGASISSGPFQSTDYLSSTYNVGTFPSQVLKYFFQKRGAASSTIAISTSSFPTTIGDLVILSTASGLLEFMGGGIWKVNKLTGTPASLSTSSKFYAVAPNQPDDTIVLLSYLTGGPTGFIMYKAT